MTQTVDNRENPAKPPIQLFDDFIHQKQQAAIAELGFEGLHVNDRALLHFTTAVNLRMGDLADGYFKMGLFEHDSATRMNCFTNAATLGNVNAQYLVLLYTFQQLLVTAREGNITAQSMIRTMAVEGLVQPYYPYWDFVSLALIPRPSHHHQKHLEQENAQIENAKEVEEEAPHPHMKS